MHTIPDGVLCENPSWLLIFVFALLCRNMQDLLTLVLISSYLVHHQLSPHTTSSASSGQAPSTPPAGPSTSSRRPTTTTPRRNGGNNTEHRPLPTVHRGVSRRQRRRRKGIRTRSSALRNARQRRRRQRSPKRRSDRSFRYGYFRDYLKYTDNFLVLRTKVTAVLKVLKACVQLRVPSSTCAAFA